MIKVLHFKDNELMDFLEFCLNHEDIEYKWRRIKNPKYPYSVEMKYSKKSTNEEIYKKVNEIRG